MKFRIISLIAILSVLILSISGCEDNNLNEDSYNKTSTNNINNLYNDIIEIDDLEEQLQVANSLSGEEKYNLWQLKLDNFKNNNDLNNEQVEFIDDLKNEIKLEIFTDTIKREKFNLNKKDSILSESKSKFGDNLGQYLLTKFENSNQTLDKLGGRQRNNTTSTFDPISHCDCSKDSHCTRLTGVSIFGLSWEYGTCSSTDCVRDNVAIFGFEIWESPDNGLCSY